MTSTGSKLNTAKAPAGLKRKGSNGPNSGTRPYNHYNLYFILERELFLQARGVFPSSNSVYDIQNNYGFIDLPPLPSRYASLVLPYEWYIHKKKKRAHVKSHGIISFRDMAAMIANSWKQEGEDMTTYFKVVAIRVKTRLDELMEVKKNSLQNQPAVVPSATADALVDKKPISHQAKKLKEVVSAPTSQVASLDGPFRTSYGNEFNVPYNIPLSIGSPRSSVFRRTVSAPIDNKGHGTTNKSRDLTAASRSSSFSSSDTFPDVDVSNEEIIAMWNQYVVI